MDILALISRREFTDEDIIYLNKVADILHVATINDEPAIGKNKTIVLPDYPVDINLIRKTNYYDALAIIADEGWKELNNNIIKIILTGFLHSNKLVILTGLSPVLLAKFSLVNGITVTYRRDLADYDSLFKKSNIYIVNTPFFLDNNILTIRESKYLLKLKTILELSGKNILL